MVYFGEWSTGFPEKGGNPVKAPKKREPVVHFGEWATSYPEKGRNPVNTPKYRELVVHFKEWSTGFPEKGRIQAKAPKSQSSPKSCVKICRLSYSLFAFGEVDKEGACVSLPGIV